MSKGLRKILYLIGSGFLLGVIILISSNDIIELYRIYSNADYMEKFIESYGRLGAVIFIFFQILQVLAFFIPGEFIQAAGGYIFGTLLGTFLSVVGILIGSTLTFLVSRRYGDSLLRKILPQKDYRRIKGIIMRPRNRLVIFVLYLIPGFPKDALGYVSGITSIKLLDFIIISSMARLPGIIVTSYVGSNIYNENYLLVIYILMALSILLFIGIVHRNKVFDYFKN